VTALGKEGMISSNRTFLGLEGTVRGIKRKRGAGTYLLSQNLGGVAIIV